MRSLLLFAALVSSTVAEAKTVKVKPEKIQDAQVVRTVTLTDQVGAVRDVIREDDTLYVAGTTGLAAVGADGEVRWTLELPLASFRWVGLGEEGIALSSYSLGDVDPAEGFGAFLFGKSGERPRWTNVEVALVTREGSLRWSVDGVDDRSASRPAVGEGYVAVSYGPELLVLSAADGSVVGQGKIEGTGADTKVFGGIVANSSRQQPLIQGGTVYTSFLNKVAAFKPSGEKIADSIGGLPGIGNATCGLVAWKDRIWVGNAELNTDAKNAVWGFSPDNVKKFKKIDLDDRNSGCSELVAVDDALFAVTNFQVTKLNPKGKELWVATNKKGGIFPTDARGLRYQNLGASWSRWPLRKVHTPLVAADAKHIIVPARIYDVDNLVVLDSATGAHVTTLKLPKAALGTVLLDDAVVVAEADGLAWVARP